MRAEFFTVATPSTLGLERLQWSLAKFGHSLIILGQDAPGYRGMGWKFKTFLRGIRGSSAETVLFCDGYDTLCLEPLESILSKFAALAHPIIFSYEPQSRPEFCLSLNSGLLIANRLALLAVFDEETLDDAFPDHFNDEAQLQTIYSRDPDIFKIDAEGAVFLHGRRAFGGFGGAKKPAGKSAYWAGPLLYPWSPWLGFVRSGGTDSFLWVAKASWCGKVPLGQCIMTRYEDKTSATAD